MADDLDIKRVQSLLTAVKEAENSYHPSLTNWSVNLVKQIVSLKTNEYEIIRFKNEFIECATNEDRVSFVLNNQQIKDKLYEILEEKTYDTKSNAKDWQKAKKFREEGKKSVDANETDNALWYYWRAIALSPFPGSRKHETDESKQQLALAFFDRSQLLFQLKRYADCLQDIENAIKFGLTFTSHPKLLLLKIKCSKFIGELQTMTAEAQQNLIDALEEYEADTKDPKLTEEIVDLIEEIKNPFGVRDQTSGKRKTFSGCLHNGDNKQLRCASKSIELKSSPEKGRHLIAKDDIPGGSDLIIEKPYASVLCLLAYKDYCYNCFKELKQCGFPCETCDKVTFCGEDCANNAKKYHGHECDYMNILIDAEMYHLALKTLLVTGVSKAIDSQGQSATENVHSDSSLLSMVEHSEELPFVNSLCYTLIASFYALLIRDKMKLFSTKDDDMLVNVAAVLLRHIKQIIFNATAVNINDETELGLAIDGTKIGLGIYPTFSLVNHSCDANSVAVFSGSTLFLKSRKNLKKGDEITVSYGVQVNHESKNMRTEELRKYYFECKCHCCEDDIEKYRDALLCPKCNGPVVYEELNYSCRCLQCEEENVVSVVEVLNELKSLRTTLQYTAAYYHSGRIKNPKESFEKIHEKLMQICFPKNQFLLQMKDILANIYKKTNEFEKAVEMGQQILKADQSLFGNDCVYNIYRSVFVTLWRWHCIEASQDDSKHKQLIEDTKKVIETAERVFSDRKEQGFVLISTNYVNCYKELQELSTKVKFT